MENDNLSLDQQAALAAQELLNRRNAKSSLKGFIQYTYPNFVCAPHHQLMLDRIEDLLSGKIKKLMIFCPPRHGKTLIVSKHLPAYYLGHYPGRFVIMSSYEQELALIAGRYVRNLVDDQKFKNVFGDVSLSSDSKAAGRWNTNKDGGYFAVGIGGGDGSGLTGRGGHLAIIDDPLKGRLNADSEIIREGIKSWYQSTLLTRLMKDHRILLTLTRWHHDDIAGWLLENSATGEWEVLNMHALAEENDPLGRIKGEALWPEFLTAAELRDMRDNPTKIGAREFESLYQQNPTAAKGDIFKVAGFRRWNQFNLPTQFDLEVISMDTNVSPGVDNDDTVIQHWAKSGSLFYLLDEVRGNWGMTQQLNAFKIFCDARPWVPSKLVEKKANGAAIIDMLTRWVSGLIPVEPIGNKEQRALAVEPYVTAGNIFIPEAKDAPWVDKFVLECAQFPHGKHDDAGDTMTQAVNYMARHCQQMADYNEGLLYAFGNG